MVPGPTDVASGSGGLSSHPHSSTNQSICLCSTFQKCKNTVTKFDTLEQDMKPSKQAQCQMRNEVRIVLEDKSVGFSAGWAGAWGLWRFFILLFIILKKGKKSSSDFRSV